MDSPNQCDQLTAAVSAYLDFQSGKFRDEIAATTFTASNAIRLMTSDSADDDRHPAAPLAINLYLYFDFVRARWSASATSAKMLFKSLFRNILRISPYNSKISGRSFCKLLISKDRDMGGGVYRLVGGL